MLGVRPWKLAPPYRNWRTAAVPIPEAAATAASRDPARVTHNPARIGTNSPTLSRM